MLGLGGDDPTRLGPYRLRAVIGDGGMGRVYLATSPAGRAVAVKVIGPGLADQPNYRERFAREARAAMAVSGLYTASVVDADTTGERPYLATEYVPAPSLADVVKTVGPLPASTVSALAGGLAEALAAIHRAGLVHRDVKPHNILLAPNGPVVIDFGIALADEAQTSLTAVGMAVGSPGYIAPEVLSGQEPTPATDMFGLACALVYAARGVGPFGKGDPLSIAHRTVSQEPDLDGLPEFIKGLVRPLLSRDPASRPSPAQLLEHLAIVGQDVVLHDAQWLPESVRELLVQRRAQVQVLLGGNGNGNGHSGQTDAGYGTGSPPTAAAQRTVPLAYPPPPSNQPVSQPMQQPVSQPMQPPMPVPLAPPRPPAPPHRLRNALLATGGAVVVAAAVATTVVLAQGKDHGPGGTTGTRSATADVVALSTGSAGQAATTPAASTSATPSATPTPTPTPTATATATATATGVLGYKPGTYKLNKLISTDTFGYSSVYLVDITVNGDGSVQADLRYTNNTGSDQQFTCYADTKDEAQLVIGGESSVYSTATACTDDPSYTKDVPPGGSITGYDKFPSAPAGSGSWTYSLSTIEYSGSVTGIDIPTQ
ncbi:serine/threonine protein kinase [Actinospica durhamensis]|uniref:Serine/threonine protein kinase n=1 Tax=Actinospica durhamensis TaxID=1508375 RepID=A0A941ELS4_9ACTN|nr:serine/threonine-protein kinase [Actinospica durhamensis]MBR7833671.1 serine/threonine protein kinase [Actinospica durhamensis]